MAEDRKLTFFSKNAQVCPLCEAPFFREELLTGGGRMIAGKLTRDLRRLYEPSKKFGEIFPLVYTITVCPRCYYAAFSQDFFTPPATARPALTDDTEKREKSIVPLFGPLDFKEPRTLKEGAAAYFLAMMCYDHFTKDESPTVKQAVCALRAAWTFSDLYRRLPEDNYDFLAMNFYRKARFFYSQAVEKEQTGKEGISAMKNLGPDLEKNYGFDGVLYLFGLFEYLYGPKKDKKKRLAALTKAKTTVAKIFGMGKASKNKPAVLLDRAKELYTEISRELDRLGGGFGGLSEPSAE
ncbi:MAG: DUF2225 domain-containing protein [Spirochaetaceae bacterium]|nr:DUF2225 domain-containing protein [Spirochaetaceae bacterium]